jgi:hypothetical protein
MQKSLYTNALPPCHETPVFDDFIQSMETIGSRGYPCKTALRAKLIIDEETETPTTRLVIWIRKTTSNYEMVLCKSDRSNCNSHNAISQAPFPTLVSPTLKIEIITYRVKKYSKADNRNETSRNHREDRLRAGQIKAVDHWSPVFSRGGDLTEDIRKDQYGTCNRAPNHGAFSQGLLEWNETENERTRRKSGYVGISASEQEQIVAHV